MKKYIALKLIGLTLLTMATLVVISILEVTVYSYMINPGQDISVYDAHAESSAPFISGIFGFIVFFFVARYWKRKGNENSLQLALLFPATYLALDIIILVVAGVDWSQFFLIFILANGAKFLGSYSGYKLSRKKHQ